LDGAKAKNKKCSVALVLIVPLLLNFPSSANISSLGPKALIFPSRFFSLRRPIHAKYSINFVLIKLAKFPGR
jgi:hypothetical protein